MKVGDLVKFNVAPHRGDQPIWWLGILLKYTLHLDRWDILHSGKLLKIEHGNIQEIGKKDESW